VSLVWLVKDMRGACQAKQIVRWGSAVKYKMNGEVTSGFCHARPAATYLASSTATRLSAASALSSASRHTSCSLRRASAPCEGHSGSS
jgi:hypothetical protein